MSRYKQLLDSSRLNKTRRELLRAEYLDSFWLEWDREQASNEFAALCDTVAKRTAIETPSATTIAPAMTEVPSTTSEVSSATSEAPSATSEAPSATTESCEDEIIEGDEKNETVSGS
ncbi:hypothetical protein BGZ49_001184 [Haplosporangium sp. Z 27]|nr:hypothetical protein BGZ49_001184 [Haplosporangium sp. Z 27]